MSRWVRDAWGSFWGVRRDLARIRGESYRGAGFFEGWIEGEGITES